MARALGRWVAAGLMLLAGLLAAAPPGEAGPAPTDAVPWTTVTTLQRGVLPAVSCAATTWCWAVAGGELLSSDDGGASWTTRSALLPADVGRLDAVDCPVVGRCYVAGSSESAGTVVLLVTDGSVLVAPVDAQRLDSISCSGPKSCVATDGARLARTINGTVWKTRNPPVPAGTYAVSCAAGSSSCWAVGSLGGQGRTAYTPDQGLTWTQQQAPSATAALSAVDCPTTQVCHAVGTFAGGPVAAATDDGGATWTRQSVPATHGALRSVSCPAIAVCWAFGADGGVPIGFGTTDSGGTWTPQSLPTGTGLDTVVSCPTVTTCAAVARNGVAFSTTNAGAAWQPVGVPVALTGIRELSCPTRLRCVGVTQDVLLRPLVLTSTDAGHSWVRRTLPGGVDLVTALDCPTELDCRGWGFKTTTLADGTSRNVGVSLASADGGESWALHNGPDTRPLATAELACQSPEVCLAAGTVGTKSLVRVTSDGGHTWQTAAAPPDIHVVVSVTCGETGAAARECLVLGRTGTLADQVDTVWQTVDLGAGWWVRPLPVIADHYQDLDCAGRVCVASGNDGAAGAIARSGNGGTTWAPVAVPAGATVLRDVDCGRAAVCAIAASGAAAGNGARVLGTSDQGRTWSISELPPSGVVWPLTVACTPYRTTCLASDYGLADTPRVLSGDVGGAAG